MNLDAICAQYAVEIIDGFEKRMNDIQVPVESKMDEKTREELVKQRSKIIKEMRKHENCFRNAVAVLREDGLYACYLFLHYRSEEGGKTAKEVIERLYSDENIALIGKDGKLKSSIVEITKNLDCLLLARNITERMLVYAIYNLRALQTQYEQKQEATPEPAE